MQPLNLHSHRGTGASAIYPLLGCALEPTWAFIATELDERSYNFASTNVCINNLSDRICVVKISGNTSGDSEVHSQDGKLQFGFEHLFSEFGGKNDSAYDDGMEIQFTMCNPPFYRSLEDVTESEAVKEFAAFGVCTGAPVEMITPGGEVHFVGAMVRESVHSKAAAEEGVTRLGEDHKLKEKRRRAADGSVLPRAAETEANSTHPSRSERQVVRWYTSMLGKMSSVEEIVKVFKELTITNYAITEFVQGQTRRWAVGWSHSSYRLSDDIARIAHPNPTLQRLLPLRNTLRFPLGDGAGELLQRVLDDMEGINVSLRRANDRADNGEKCEVCMVLAMQDSWSRGARRKRKRDAALGSEGAAATLDPALACLVAVVPGEVPDLEVRWVYGRDRALFESFASHVAAKVNRGCTVGATALF
ncbi:hypothetical protein H0H81_007327 [Sphagnurus paluster]|uniref:Uncharacterized protein n=1 Tax=Sphagnurus paluster TaxID=117069 RepID=A0A9P7GQU0_9AGAR|nr:hypothetical protein H0H81_007327 [Sphagnurus paluster]